MTATTLSSGDLAIIGFNFDDPDEFAFTPLIDIGAGTEINFTDNGWQAAGSFRDTEGTFTWTAPTDITAGTIINPTISSILFSASGDQIIAYQGDETNPTFIYALNSEGNPGVWQSDSTSSNTSALPTGLTNGETAVALDEIDNAIYTGITSGSKAELLAAISDKSNWSGDNSNRQTMLTDPFTVSGSGSNLVINEVYASHTGTDNTEFIELFGTPGTSLDGLSLVAVEGDSGISGAIDARIDFDTTNAIGDNGFFLVGNPTGLASNYGVVPNLDISDNFLENSSSTFALVETSSISGTSVTGSEIVLDTVALTDGGAGDTFFFDAPVIGPDGSFFPAGARRITDGVDTDTVDDWVISDFNLGAANTPTAGTSDNGNGGGGNGEITPIYEIQGSGDTSSLVGQTVTTQGIVVGDFQGSDELRGFFIQDPTGDSNTATSDGIFVFVPTANTDWFGFDVQPGQLVEVTGRVNEFNTFTEIDFVTDISIVDPSNNSLSPTPVTLPETTDGELEQYEGMFVEISHPMTVSQNFFLGRYGQMTLSSPDDEGEVGRIFQPTNQFRPLTPEAIALAEENARRLLILDDGQDVNSLGDNPLPVPYIGDPPITNIIRGGDTVTNLVGVLDYGRINSSSDPARDYRLHPTVEPIFTTENPRTTTPETVGGSLQVGSFNVLNYFNGDGQGGGFPTSRGADSLSEFNRQRDKIIDAIVSLDTDILGLVEIENDGYGANSAIQDLVNGINDIVGAGTYDFIDPGVSQLGTDEITVGFIYKPDAVSPVGNAAILDKTVDPDFNTDVQRPSLAQTFQENGTAEKFTVSVNHLKSKGSLTGIPADADQGDGQGNNNFTRTIAAEALTNWLESDPTNSGDPDFLIVGDLNAYAEEDPIQAIKDAGYTDLLAQYQGDDAYSYTFDGQAGYLDHGLANSTLAAQVTGATEWHINTDEAEVLDYDEEFNSEPYYTADAYRASDHDPLVVGLNLTTPGAEINGTADRDNLTGTDGNDVITGFQGRDILTGGDGSDIFAYNSIVDAVDIITDFEVGSDKVDLAAVLNGLGFTGIDPITEGYVGFTSRGTDTILTIDPDGTTGTASSRSLFLAQGVVATALNNSDNFIFN